jgi:hypothetical protein
MTDFDRNDLNLLVDHFRDSPDADKAAEFVLMSPDARYAYLVELRGATRGDVAPRKRATLWNIERKLVRLDQELRNAGR